MPNAVNVKLLNASQTKLKDPLKHPPEGAFFLSPHAGPQPPFPKFILIIPKWRLKIHKDTQLVKSVEFIRLNACSKIRVDDIVATTGLSRRTFELRFQALTGHSVQDEIEDVRLRTAMDLLTSTRASVDSIAQRCGYSGASSLLHLFAKHLNTTPADWRKGGGKR